MIPSRIIPTMHSEQHSLILNSIEIIDANIASATIQISLKIKKKSIDSFNAN